MNRRAFLAATAGSLLAAPLAAEAQRAGKVPRIGYLHVVPRPSPFLQMLGQGLRDLGYVEDQNFAFEFRSADGKVEPNSEYSTPWMAKPLAAKPPRNSIRTIIAGTRPK